MFLKIIRDIAKPQWFEIIMLLKRSVGMSVSELAKALGMSYMGVKQHCVVLEKRGYVDTWRRPKEIGRPEKAYRLTPKANELFPQIGSELTLEILDTIKETNGANAAEKLLFAYFQKIGRVYQEKVNGETPEQRAGSLARIRDHEGRLSSCLLEAVDCWSIVEYHDPLSSIAAVYPTVHHMEEKMLERIIGRPISRELETASGLTRITFRLG
ncbi:MAG: putative ArsR family transcriptional regulator [Pseudoalteromonas tetraodonis]|jgi:predicted ArsR family transcriptional regulator